MATVNKNFVIKNGLEVGSNNLLYVDAVNNRIGIGTTTSGGWTTDIYRNIDGPGNNLRLANASTGTAAYSLINISTGGNNAYLFTNSPNRTTDGGTSTTTLRNDSGDLRLQASGSVGIHVQSTSGNVGLGTTNPLATLDVRGNLYVGGVDAGPNFIAFRGTTGDGPGNYSHGYIGERIWGGTESSELVIFKGNDPGSSAGQDRVRIIGAEIRFDTYATATSGAFETVATSANVTNKVIITNDGTVGIGTTNPASASAKLDVWGNAYIRNIGGPSFLEIGQGQTSNQFAYIDLIGDTTYNDYGFRIIRGNTGANTPTDIIHRGLGDFRLFTNEAASITFNTTNSEKVRIDPTGNVGVGTNIPLQKLHVLGNVLVAAGTSTSQHITQRPYTINNGTLSWEGSAGQLFSITNNLTSGSIFSVNDVSGIPSIDIDANGTIQLAPFGGFVGIGTTAPATTLDVRGVGATIRVQDPTNNYSLVINPTGASGPKISFGTSGGLGLMEIGAYGNFNNIDTKATDLKVYSSAVSNIIYVKNADGNVGIATTTPANKLHIASSGDVLRLDSSSTSCGILMYDSAAAVRIGSRSGSIIFDTSSTEMVRITTAGLVGVGITNPGCKFEISTGDNWNYPNLALRRTASNTGNARFITFPLGGDSSFDPTTVYAQMPTIGVNYSSTPSAASTSIGLNATLYLASPNGLQLYTNNNARLTVDQNGNVGIGTASIGTKLTVYDGNVLVNATNGGNVTIYNRTSTATSYPQYRAEHFTNGFGGFPVVELISSNGTGTTPTSVTASQTLGGYNTWGHNGTSYISATRIESITETTFSTSVSAAIKFLTTSAGTQAERVRITGSGNVGIGITNPGSPLAVNGYITENPGDGTYWNVVTQKDIGYAANQVPLNQYLGQLAFLDAYSPYSLRRDGGGSDDLFVNSQGFIGIGTTNPGYNVDVYNGRIQARYAADAIRITTAPGDDTGQTSMSLIRIGAATDQKKWEIIHGNTGTFEIRSINDAYSLSASAFLITRGTSYNLGYTRISANTLNTITAGSVTTGIYLTNQDTAYGLNITSNSATGASHLQVQRSDSTTTLYPLTLNPIGGNVGVGTTNPLNTLYVNGGTTILNSGGNQLLLHTGSNIPTLIQRNDGAIFYFLLSAAGSTPSGTWNSLRPLKIDCVSGALSSDNGQVFSGGTTIQDTLNVGISAKAGTFAQAGTTSIVITPTITYNHTITTGDSIYLDAFTVTTGTGTYTNGYYIVSSVTATTITVVNPNGSFTASGTLTIYPENKIRFPGAYGDGSNSYDHTVISERLWGGSDKSELLIYKGNDGGTTIQDNIRLAATGDIYLHSGTGTGTYSGFTSNAGFGASVASSTVSVKVSGNVGIGSTLPSAKVQIVGGGSASASTAPLKISVSATTLMTTPEADAFEYDRTLLYHTDNDTTNGHGRALIPEYQYVRRTSDLSITAVASPGTSFFGATTRPALLAGNIYEIEAVIFITKVTNAGTITAQAALSTGNFTFATLQSNTSSGAIVVGGTASPVTIFTSASLTAGSTYGITIKGLVQPASNSRFDLLLYSSATSTTALTNSYMKVTCLGTGSTIGNFG